MSIEMKTLTIGSTTYEIVDENARSSISALSEEIVTTSESKVSAHNTGTDTHGDIRLLIQDLTGRLNALADSDDTTLDQLSEIVAYIKSNKSLIDAITTSKVNVADIIDNLTTNASNKPLSAAQGVALKALIDAISIPDKLPNPNALTFTGAVTGSYDGSEPLTVEIPSGGGTEGKAWTYLGEFDLSVANTVEFTELQNVTEIYVRWADVKNEKTTASAYVLRVNDVIVINGIIPVQTTNTVYGWSWAKYNGLYWTGSATNGYKSDKNSALNASASQAPYYVNTEVGKAQSIKLAPTSATWAATTGILNVYVR